MTDILIKSPTRVDLAGGTIDLWPLYNFIGGRATTVNVAIDVWTQVHIKPRTDKKIVLKSLDLKDEIYFENLEVALVEPDPKWSLLHAQLEFWKPKMGFELESQSQSPVGGGLGGSSSLTVSLMKAFSKLTHSHFSSVHKLVHCAHNIEAQVLNTPTGTQDYYPAASGGINILKYSTRNIEQEVLPIESSALAKNFLLVYTGKTHHSGLNNFEVLKSAVAKDKQVLNALSKINEIAEATEAVVRSGNYSELETLFREEYKARIQLTPAFTSPEIEKLSHVALEAGAKAVKICGAGGGGCVLVWAPFLVRDTVAQALELVGFQVMNSKPVEPLID